MTNITISNAVYKDWAAISTIEQQCFPTSEAASESAIKERLYVYPQGCFVARINNEIIGFINGGATNATVAEDRFYASMNHHNNGGRHLVIFGLDVHPDYQRKGYATQLMTAFITFATKGGKSAILLTCKEHLIDFYASFGYENLGPSHSNHGGAKWYDMQLTLKV